MSSDPRPANGGPCDAFVPAGKNARRCRRCARGHADHVLAVILRGFDERVFVRSVAHDHEPGWVVRLMPYIQALATAYVIVKREKEQA